MALSGILLVFLGLGLGFPAMLAASLFAVRAKKLGYDVNPGNRPFAIWWIGWPATFDMLEFESRLAQKDAMLRFLFGLVLWLNRIILSLLLLAVAAAVSAALLGR